MRQKKILNVLLFLLLTVYSSNAATYYLISSGNITSKNNWNTSPLNTGSQPANFTGAGDVWIFQSNTANGNRTTGSITNALFPVSSSAIVTIESGFNLTISSNGSVAGFFNISNGGVLTISNGNAVKFGTLGATSTVIFNSALQSVDTRAYGNLTINQSLSLSGSGTLLDVSGLLTLASGITFNINSKDLSLSGSAGSISGTGFLTGTANSVLTLQGGNGSNNGTLYFLTGNYNLKELVMNYDNSTDYISLGNNLTIVSGAVALYYGTLNLNGKILTIDASSDINFTASNSDGVIKAASGALIINGSVGGLSSASDMYVDGTDNIFSALYLNNNTTLAVADAIIISDSISSNLGTIQLGGNVTLKADATKTARIGRSSGTLSGNLTVQTYLPGTSTGWANLGSPGVSGQTIASWDTYVTSGSLTGVPLACTGCYYGTGYSNGFNSTYSWSEPTTAYVAATAATALTPGQGFWIYVGTGFSTTTALKLVNSGSPVTGSVNYPVTASSGNFNLVANPYASPIAWSKTYALGTNNTRVNNAIYIWNADLGVTTSYAAGVSSHGAGAKDIIPAGQGFYVEATSAGNLSFDETVKMTANTSANPVLRGAASNYIGEIFRVSLAGKDGDRDETAFRIHPMATPLYDGAWDAHKIFQSPGYVGYPGPYTKYTTISSKDFTGEDYSIHSFPEPSKDLNFPLLVRVMQSGTYTISASGLENIPSCLLLKDKLLNKTHDLQMGDYVFTINDSTSAPRFELQLCKGVAAINSIQETKLDAQSVQIRRAESGISVNTAFAQATEARIEVYNLLGQSLSASVIVNGTTNSTFLPVADDNGIILVKVTTATDSYSKKVLLR